MYFKIYEKISVIQETFYDRVNCCDIIFLFREFCENLSYEK